MRSKLNDLCAYAAYVGITLSVLVPLQVAQAYYAYSEYDAISPLFGLMPPHASVQILVNILVMPLSWLVGFVSVIQLLPQEDLRFSKRKFALVVIPISSLLCVVAVTNTVVFHAHTFRDVTVGLTESLHRYLDEPTVKESWDNAMPAMRCCGVFGPSDWLKAGYLNAPCFKYSLGCTQVIQIGFYALLGWSLLAQFASILISLNGVAKATLCTKMSAKLKKIVSYIM